MGFKSIKNWFSRYCFPCISQVTNPPEFTSAPMLQTQDPSNKEPIKKFDVKLLSVSNLSDSNYKSQNSFPSPLPFSIADCTNSSISILEPVSQVTIDCVVNSTVVLGPCEGSIFIRDSKNTTFILLSRQIRFKNCSHLTVILHVLTPPVLENCTNVSLCAYRGSYPELKDHFKIVGLSRLGNAFKEAHDFTGFGWSIAPFPESVTVEGISFSHIPGTAYSHLLGISFDPENAFIPIESIDKFAVTELWAYNDEEDACTALKQEKCGLIGSKRIKTSVVNQKFQKINDVGYCYLLLVGMPIKSPISRNVMLSHGGQSVKDFASFKS